MPIYVPSPRELDSVHEAVRNYNPEDFGAFREYLAFIADHRRWTPVPLPIRKLLDDLARMLANDWPLDPMLWPQGIDQAVISRKHSRQSKAGEQQKVTHLRYPRIVREQQSPGAIRTGF
jgi:hypothetical protein